MIPTECVDLVELIQHLCPAQAINAGTPDAWFPLLADVPLDDAVAAVYGAKRHGRRFIDVTDVLDGYDEIRAERLARSPEPVPPIDPNDPVAYRDWLRNHRAAVAAGRPTQELTA
jgi:hypothetical protein